MIQLRPWKVALVVLATIFGILFTLPNIVPAGKMPAFLPSQRLNLGLDLQGGSYLLLEVDVASLKAEQQTNLIEDVRRTLQTDQILFSGLGVVNGQVSVRVTDPLKVEKAYTDLAKLAQPLAGSSGVRDLTVLRGSDQTITLASVAQSDRALTSKAVDQSIEIIRRRIDALGTREPSITRQGDARIVIEAAGESDPEKLKAVIGKTAKLTFQMVDDSVTPAEAASGHVPPGSILLPEDTPYEKAVVVKKQAVVSGEMLIGANQEFDQNGTPSIGFRFNSQGAHRFGAATQANVGKRFAIVLDGRVISAPTIQGAITDRLRPDHRLFPAGRGTVATSSLSAALRRPACAKLKVDPAVGPWGPSLAPTRCGPAQSRSAIGARRHRGVHHSWPMACSACSPPSRSFLNVLMIVGADVADPGDADPAGHRRSDPDPGRGGGRQCADL